MSLSGDSCSTSSGCVSDMDNMSEDQSPDSPISDTFSDSLISSTDSVTKSLPNIDDFDKELIITDTTLVISINRKVPDVGQDVYELLEEELIENEIIIDYLPIDCGDGSSLNQILTANCYELQYDHSLVREESEECYQAFKTSFDSFTSSLCSKLGTASIKSDTSQTSGHESDGTRQSSDSSGHNTAGIWPMPALKGLFKDVKDFKCLSATSKKSEGINTNINKTSSDCNSSDNSAVHYCCKWTNCDWPGSKDDLVDHIRELHVELQPYQQQKHNWNDVQQTKAKNRSPNSCKSIKSTDSSLSSSGPTKKVESAQQQQHQQYVCLWESCKVYGKGSSSRNWLERHVLEQHSGPRPFKCIVEGCGQRFKVQSALERHVNSHFKPSMDCSNSNCSTDVINMCSNSCFAINGSNDNTMVCPNSVHGLSAFELHLHQTSCRATMSAVSSKTGVSSGDPSASHHMCTNGTPNKILKRKKSNQKVRRKCVYVKCSDDYFDECVMEKVRYGLIQLNTNTGLDISGNKSTITFHSQVIARRENDSGEVNVLLKWEPTDILPDIWVTEDKVLELKSKTVPVSTLPPNCLAQLIENSDGFERKPKIKQRRK